MENGKEKKETQALWCARLVVHGQSRENGAKLSVVLVFCAVSRDYKHQINNSVLTITHSRM